MSIAISLRNVRTSVSEIDEPCRRRRLFLRDPLDHPPWGEWQDALVSKNGWAIKLSTAVTDALKRGCNVMKPSV